MGWFEQSRSARASFGIVATRTTPAALRDRSPPQPRRGVLVKQLTILSAFTVYEQ